MTIKRKTLEVPARLKERIRELKSSAKKRMPLSLWTEAIIERGLIDFEKGDCELKPTIVRAGLDCKGKGVGR